MSEENTNRRRRRRPATPVQQPEEQQTPVEPIRIIAASDDEPDWLVSATSVSGAASRRANAAKRGGQGGADHAHAVYTGKTVMTMKKKPQAEGAALPQQPAQPQDGYMPPQAAQMQGGYIPAQPQGAKKNAAGTAAKKPSGSGGSPERSRAKREEQSETGRSVMRSSARLLPWC